MTYDERQEIAEWLDIVKKNCERTLRSIEQLNNVLGGIHCVKGRLFEEILTLIFIGGNYYV